METSQEAAVAAINTAEAAGNVAAALVVFDALDANAEHLTSFDRYDFALSAWRRMVDLDAPLANADIVAAIIRASKHLPEHTVVDLIDAHFGEHPQDIRLADGRNLVWLPADEVAILSGPFTGGVVDVVLGRNTRRTA